MYKHDQRVTTMLTIEEVRSIDKERGNVPRSAYIRQILLDHLFPKTPTREDLLKEYSWVWEDPANRIGPEDFD